MTALARKLQSRGHDVVFLSLADVAPFVEAAGLAFVPCSETAYPAGSLSKLVRRLSELSGEEALHFTVNSMMKGYTASLFEALPDTLAKAGVDGIGFAVARAWSSPAQGKLLDQACAASDPRSTSFTSRCRVEYYDLHDERFNQLVVEVADPNAAVKLVQTAL
jgi:hypothetical protein